MSPIHIVFVNHFTTYGAHIMGYRYIVGPLHKTRVS